MSNIVKQDINFCEYPIWFQDCRQKEGMVWNDLEGYVYRTGYKAPAKTDVIFLYYLMLRSQQDGWKEDLSLTQGEVLRGCGIIPGKTWRKRLQDSLERWMHIVIDFQGNFYNGKNYERLQFHILEYWGFSGKKKRFRNTFFH